MGGCNAYTQNNNRTHINDNNKNNDDSALLQTAYDMND